MPDPLNHPSALASDLRVFERGVPQRHQVLTELKSETAPQEYMAVLDQDQEARGEYDVQGSRRLECGDTNERHFGAQYALEAMKPDEIKLSLHARPRCWNSRQIAHALIQRGSIFHEEPGRHERRSQLRYRFFVSLGILYEGARFLWVGQMYQRWKYNIAHGCYCNRDEIRASECCVRHI
jgi:hypothetical protein